MERHRVRIREKDIYIGGDRDIYFICLPLSLAIKYSRLDARLLGGAEQTCGS